jgi:hypothetical protein
MVNDGLRYVASLQSETDQCCYKDFFEGTKYEEAKQKADEAADKNKRSALVYDRELMEITYKKVVESTTKVVEVKNEEKPRKTRTAKKKQETYDEYFE